MMGKSMNGGNAHKENMKKKTPKKAVKSPVIGKKESSLPDNIRLNRDLSDIDRDVFAPQVFFNGRRRVAVMTLWFPSHYDEVAVSALVNDGGRTLTVTFCPPSDFLSPVTLAATSMASRVGSNLGEAYGVFYDTLPRDMKKKFVFDLPFQAEERLCPEALGKPAGAQGVEVVDIDFGSGRAGRQLILAVREVLSEDLKKEVVGRRIFRMSNPNQQGQQGQQQHSNQQQHFNQAQQQQQHFNQAQQQQQQHFNQAQQQFVSDSPQRGRVRPFEEIGMVGDVSIHSSGSNGSL